MTYPRDAQTNVLVAVHYNALIRLVEDVREARADVVEQTHGVSKEVSRSKHTVDLRHGLFLVVQLYALDQ